MKTILFLFKLVEEMCAEYITKQKQQIENTEEQLAGMYEDLEKVQSIKDKVS